MLEREKNKPNLYSCLDHIYHNPTEDSPHIINTLREETDRFLSQNSELGELMDKHAGCRRFAPDSFIYNLLDRGPNISMRDTIDDRKTKLEIYKEEEQKIRRLTNALDYHTRTIRVSLKLLGLEETNPEKPRSITGIVNELSDFFKNIEIEEELLRKSKPNQDRLQ